MGDSIEAAIDLTPVLESITQLLLAALRGTDPRRFAIVHQVSKSTIKLNQVLSQRVEDFEDPHRPKRSGIGYFKEMLSTPQVAVPRDLDSSAAEVLRAMTKGLEVLLTSSRRHRFNEVERLADAALHFIGSVAAPAEKRRGARGDVAAIGCADPEGAYVADGLEDDEEPAVRRAQAAALRNGPADENQLRREILEIEGVESQILGELATAKIAREEAAELAHLLDVQKSGDPSLLAPTTVRIEQLRAKLVFRTKGQQDAVVSANVLRGHLTGSEGTRDDPSESYPHAAERAHGSRSSPEESASEALRMFPMGEA